MAEATIAMKLQGPEGLVDGECTVEGYEGYIKLDDWKWSLDASKERPAPSRLSLAKSADCATVPMLGLLQSCKLCPRVEILVEEDSSDSRLELKLILSNVQIVDFRLSSKVDDKSASFSENWEFQYARARFEYTSYGALDEKPQFMLFVIDAPADSMSSPSEAAEEKILALAVEVGENRLDGLFNRMREAVQEHARRKLKGEPQGGTKQQKAGTGGG